MSLNSYDYNEQVKLLPRNFNVTISENDKVITIEENGALVAILSLALEGETLKLMGKDNLEISSVELPKAQTLERAYYDKATQELVLIVNMGDGEINEIRVDVSELVDIYQEGNGIMIDEDKKIHIKIAKLSEGILNADEDGLGIDLSEYATEEDLKEEARLREKYDDLLREDLKEEARLREEEDDAQWEAINKIVDDSAAISAEVDRAMKAEANLQNNINAETETRKIDVANLQNNINAETETRKIDVANLQNNINIEVNRATAVETNLQNSISDEINRATTAEANLQNNINAETETRKIDVANLQNNINKLTSKTQEEISSLETKLNNETNKRITSDNILENKILEESIARSEEDAKLEDAINSIKDISLSGLTEEARLREEADNRLNNSINNLDTKLSNELSKKVPFTKVMKDGVEYDVIILDNHANLLGYNSDKTSTYNIGMVSKWNIVDLGSTSLPINLNGSNLRPTYNDNKEIALTEDLTSLESSILLVKKNDLEYVLMIGEKECGTISIPKDQFLKEVTYDEVTHILSFTFNTIDGETKTDINFSELVDVYTAGNGLIFDSNEFSIKIDTTTQKYIEVSSEGLKIVGVDEALNKKVDWTDISTPDVQGRKAIVLKNNDMLLGTNRSGSTANIAMINKWDIVDLGTNSLPINLNTPSGVRPTVQEAGQSGEEANKIAYVSDIDEVKDEINNVKESTNDSLSHKVDWTDISTEDNPNRKSIVLKNNDMLLGTNRSGSTANIAMINKWNIVDLGTVSLPINLNTPSGVRPTVQEAGQSGEEANKIAYVSDVQNLLGNEQSLSSEMSLYGIKKYTDEEVSRVGVGYDDKFKAIDSKFDLYVTKELAVQEHDELLSESKAYTDSTIANKSLNTITEAVNQSKIYTDAKVSALNATIVSNTERITDVENRCDHFDDLFGMILDEHEPVELKFYTKSEIDEKVNTLNLKDKEILNSIPKGIYNLGEIESFNNLSTLASAKGVCDEQDNVILTFKITTVPYGKESGFILNVRNGNKISQALYWKQALEPQMYRELTIDENGDIANVEFMPNSNRTLYKDSLPNQTIFTLTTESDSETIKTALTDVLHGSNPLTKEQLDDCLKYGYYLLESSMRVPVYVGWNGNSYTLTMFGLPNPKGELIAATVAFSINEDNTVYTITRNGSRSTILTSSNIEKNSSFINLQTTDNLLASKIAVLEEKLEKLSKTAIENVDLNGESETTFNDITKDFIISGSETKSTDIIGKTVKLDNLVISNNARTNIKSSDVELKSVQLSGDFPKDDGNAVIKVNDAEYVVVKDMVFDSSNVYNGIEIGLDSETLPKSILFENCKFLGKFSNNAILIFGTQDNAVININNCYFEDLSNAIRLSNNANVKCTLNITNCKIDKWDINSPWQGLLIMQDYTSGNAENANSNNLFAPEKIIINVINCIGPNNKKITMPTDISTICGTSNEKQIFYIWDNYRDVVPYDKSKYPTINIL